MASPFSARTDLLALGLVAVVVGALLAPTALWADEPAPRERVAISPDLRAFGSAANEPQSAEIYHGAMRRGAEVQWRSHNTPVSVLSTGELEQVVTDAALYEGTLELAREWGTLGIEAYKRVRTQEAVDYLERSLQNFETISHDLVAPDEVAEILMYLALSYLEEGTNVMRPIEVLQQMVRLDPSRQLERGYYPDFIVQYYESARDTLWRRLAEEGPRTGESQRVADLLEADYVFHGYVLPRRSDDSYELVAYLYDAADQELLPAERLVLEEIDGEAVQEGFARLASRLAVCLVEPEAPGSDTPPIAASRGTSRLAVELAVNYGSFLQYPSPLQDAFGNYGIALGASWSITREFEVFGSVSVSNSLSDYSGRLRENFTTLRGFAGVRLGRQFGPVYLGLGAGIDVARIGPVRAFSDPGCIADPDLLCPDGVGTVAFDDHGLHWGIQLRPRAAWSLSNSFQIWSGMGLGYFISPLEGQLFNFPITTEFGVNYRF